MERDGGCISGGPLRSQLFEAQVAKTPDAIAVVHEDAQLTYGELNAQANRLAHYLRGLGVGAERRVAVCVERSLEMVVGLLAVLKSGGAYVPLDASYPVERLRYLLEDSAPAAVLTHAQVPEAVGDVLRSVEATVLDLQADVHRWAGESEGNPVCADLTPQHLAYVIYTSGSTGAPKGVMVEHRHLAVKLLAAQAELEFGAIGTLPNLASHAFDISLLELLLPLISGGTSLVLKAGQVMDVAGLIARTGDATFLHAVPSLMDAWLEALGSDGPSRYPQLRCLLVGGEAVPEQLLHRLSAAFPHARVVELYGPTEAVMISTFYRAEGGGSHAVPHCIGRGFDWTRTYVVDGHGQPVPLGLRANCGSAARASHAGT